VVEDDRKPVGAVDGNCERENGGLCDEAAIGQSVQAKIVTAGPRGCHTSSFVGLSEPSLQFYSGMAGQPSLGVC
jgi:hypothetical protein